MSEHGPDQASPEQRPGGSSVPGAWGYTSSSEDDLRVPLTSTATAKGKLWVAHRPWSTVVVVVMWIIVVQSVLAVLRDVIAAATVPTSLPGADEDAPRIPIDPAVVSETRAMFITATMVAAVCAAGAIWWLLQWYRARASAELGAPRRIRVVTSVTLVGVLGVAAAVVVVWMQVSSGLAAVGALTGLPHVHEVSTVVTVVAAIVLLPVALLAVVLLRLLVAVFSRRSSSTVAPIRRRR